MAIGLALTDDVREAAALAGLPADDLDEIATEARARHEDLMRLDRRALASVGEALVGLALLHGIARIAHSDSSPHGLISMAERASALLEKMTGHSRNLYSNVRVEFAWDDESGREPSNAELIGED
ncbi:MAG: hypothetical protein RIT81_42855 [Deltaproteobacteria bacterium]